MSTLLKIIMVLVVAMLFYYLLINFSFVKRMRGGGDLYAVLETGEEVYVKFGPNSTIKDLIEQIEDETKLDMKNYKLVNNGEVIDTTDVMLPLRDIPYPASISNGDRIRIKSPNISEQVEKLMKSFIHEESDGIRFESIFKDPTTIILYKIKKILNNIDVYDLWLSKEQQQHNKTLLFENKKLFKEYFKSIKPTIIDIYDSSAEKTIHEFLCEEYSPATNSRDVCDWITHVTGTRCEYND